MDKEKESSRDNWGTVMTGCIKGEGQGATHNDSVGWGRRWQHIGVPQEKVEGFRRRREELLMSGELLVQCCPHTCDTTWCDNTLYDTTWHNKRDAVEWSCTARACTFSWIQSLGLTWPWISRTEWRWSSAPPAHSWTDTHKNQTSYVTCATV